MKFHETSSVFLDSWDVHLFSLKNHPFLDSRCSSILPERNQPIFGILGGKIIMKSLGDSVGSSSLGSLGAPVAPARLATCRADVISAALGERIFCAAKDHMGFKDGSNP